MFKINEKPFPVLQPYLWSDMYEGEINYNILSLKLDTFNMGYPRDYLQPYLSNYSDK